MFWGQRMDQRNPVYRVASLSPPWNMMPPRGRGHWRRCTHQQPLLPFHHLCQAELLSVYVLKKARHLAKRSLLYLNLQRVLVRRWLGHTFLNPWRTGVARQFHQRSHWSKSLMKFVISWVKNRHGMLSSPPCFLEVSTTWWYNLLTLAIVSVCDSTLYSCCNEQRVSLFLSETVDSSIHQSLAER